MFRGTLKLRAKLGLTREPTPRFPDVQLHI